MNIVKLYVKYHIPQYLLLVIGLMEKLSIAKLWKTEFPISFVYIIYCVTPLVSDIELS